MFRSQRKRVCDHAILRTFHLVHFFRLRLDGHILVDNADTALSCHGDRHPVFCHGVHPRTHHWNIEFDRLRQPGLQIDLIGNYFRISRHQEHVVKRNAFTDNFTHFLSSLSFVLNLKQSIR